MTEITLRFDNPAVADAVIDAKALVLYTIADIRTGPEGRPQWTGAVIVSGEAELVARCVVGIEYHVKEGYPGIETLMEVARLATNHRAIGDLPGTRTGN